YVFNPELRRSVIFGRHDVVQHAPISRLDLLVCRNTLMYFNAETQSRILARLHFALHDTGFMFLGRAELLLTHTSLFRPVSMKYRVFAKIPVPAARNGQLLIAAPGVVEYGRRGASDGRMLEGALESSPWPRLVIDQSGTLVFANHNARSTLNVRANDVGRPFHELEISYRPLELRSLIDQASSERRTVTAPSVERHLPDKDPQFFEVQVAPIMDSVGKPLGVSVSFIDITRFTRLQDELRTTNARLETAYEELQSANEELETTNEELQSTVEELETTNEELQSSNEELETMNEELQSSNEELQTLNDELRLRTGDLNEVNDFLESILGSMEAAVVVIDEHEAVQIWSRKAEQLWGMRADEAVKQLFFG